MKNWWLHLAFRVIYSEKKSRRKEKKFHIQKMKKGPENVELIFPGWKDEKRIGRVWKWLSTREKGPVWIESRPMNHFSQLNKQIPTDSWHIKRAAWSVLAPVISCPTEERPQPKLLLFKFPHQKGRRKNRKEKAYPQSVDRKTSFSPFRLWGSSSSNPLNINEMVDCLWSHNQPLERIFIHTAVV
jgi:hypothetical protein